jgi:hypothetical protein
MTSYSFNSDVAISNLQVIASLSEGQRLCLDSQTGAIAVDDRWRVVSWLSDDFDFTAIRQTFDQSMKLLSEKGLEKPLLGYIEVGEKDYLDLADLFWRAIAGLRSLDTAESVQFADTFESKLIAVVGENDTMVPQTESSQSIIDLFESDIQEIVDDSIQFVDWVAEKLFGNEEDT